jgi:hypothetical protein
VEVRLDAGSALAPAQLRAVGCTRLNVIDRADAPGPTLLAQARQVGFTARYYQLRVPASEDIGFIERLHEVLAEAPERILLPAPCALPQHPSAATGCRPARCARPVTNRSVAITTSAATCRTRMARDGQRHCDLAGVPRRDRSDFIGLGLSACSQIGEVFYRLEDELGEWRARLQSGHMGVAAGLILSEDERGWRPRWRRASPATTRLDAAAFEWRNDEPVRGLLRRAAAGVVAVARARLGAVGCTRAAAGRRRTVAVAYDGCMLRPAAAIA